VSVVGALRDGMYDTPFHTIFILFSTEIFKIFLKTFYLDIVLVHNENHGYDYKLQDFRSLEHPSLVVN
jgi:hypothetical protein